MNTFNNIIIAFDGSDCSLSALKKSIEIANQNKANLTIIEVVDTHMPLPGYYEAQNQDKDFTQFMLAQKLEVLVPVLTELEGQIQRIVRRGNVASEILAEIESNNYDLLVMGTHGSSALTRFLLGSVSTKVLHHAKIPMLVVPQ